MYRSEDDVELELGVAVDVPPLRAIIFAILGLMAAMLILGVAMAHT
jgi:hypothetical protein